MDHRFVCCTVLLLRRPSVCACLDREDITVEEGEEGEGEEGRGGPF